MYRWLEWQKFGQHNARTIAAAQYKDRRYFFASDVTFGEGTTAGDELFVRSIKAATPFAPESDTGWEVFPVGGTTDVPVGPAVFKGKLYVFAKGVDDRKIYVSSTEDGTTWREWKTLPIGGTTWSQVSTAVLNDRLYIFTRGEDVNKVWVSSTPDGTQWSPWASPFPPLLTPGGLPNIDVDLEHAALVYVGGAIPAAVHDGKVHVLLHDNDFNVLVSSSANGSQWSNWVPVGGTTAGVAGTSFDGGLLLFRTSRDDYQIHVKGSPDGVKWSGPWENIGSPPPHKYALAPFVIGGGSSIMLHVLGQGGIYSRTAIYEVDSQPDY